jgi:endo-1,4-beta-xylanase
LVLADGAWVKLSGTLVVPDCTLAEVLVYAEGPPASVDLYIDDAVLAPL